MNTGIGDAINLAWKLAAVLQRRADPSLLDTYESERIPFARLLVSTTDRVFRLISGPGLARRVARHFLFLRVIPRLLRFPTSRRTVFWRISQAHINYRHSALSAGAAGTLKGGDRLPWVPLDDGGDNFACLQSFAWQIHVYGRAVYELRRAAAAADIALHEFEWTALMNEANIMRNAGYLIRPDGHIAAIDAEPSGNGLFALLSRFAISAGATPTPGS